MEAPGMAELAAKIDRRLESLGFEKETRAFRPHITLARAKQKHIEPSLAPAVSAFEGYEFGSFVADRFYLFHSMLKPGGATYVKLREYILKES
jgi:2'-5' RNA ligase